MMRCRDCGVPIVFFTNRKGHRVPCDMKLSVSDSVLPAGRYFDRYGGEYVMLDSGRWAGPPPQAVLELHKQHNHNGRSPHGTRDRGAAR